MEGQSKETPIAKYLANLERRKSLFAGQLQTGDSPSPTGFPFISTIRRPPTGTHMKINFDDTFFSRTDNTESILHISPTVPGKKRRLSLYSDENENVEVLQKKIADLERVLRQTQSELVEGQAACTKLGQVHTETRRSYDEKIIGLEKSHEDMKLKYKNATERANSMEKQLLKLQRKDSDVTREFQTQITTQLNKISSLEGSLARLQNKNEELTMKMTENEIAEEQKLSQLQQKLDEAQKLSGKAAHESDLLQSQLSEMERRFLKAQAELSEIKIERLKHDELRKDVEVAREAQENSNNDLINLQAALHKVDNLFVKEQLKSKNLLKQLQKVEQENDILKSTVQREHLLKEQLMSAETEITVLKESLRTKGDVEGERNNLRSQVKAWIAVATKLEPSCRTPLDFDGTFRKMQDLLLQLKMDNSTLKHSVENSDQKWKALDLEVKQGRERITTLMAEKEKLALDSKKLSRRMALIVQDRDSIRGLMESYEKDFEEGGSTMSLPVHPQKLRISQLESLVSEYETTFAEDPSLRKRCEECEKHLIEIKTLEAELQVSKTENDTLSRTLVELNQSIAEQTDVTTGLKIVSFGRNPSMLSIESRLKECIAENEELKTKLKEREDNTLVAVSDNELLKEKTEMENQLKALERRYQLLSESYDYETVQLQNACTKLFGYFVTLNRSAVENPNQFRLQNIHSMGPEETFIFQEGTAGEMLLLDTPILAHFQDDIERFLRQESSVPAFLAAVTIAYTQGVQFPTTSLNTVDAAAYDDEDDTSNVEGDSLHILATESMASRQIQVDVAGEDDEDVADDMDSRGGGESDEEIYEDEEEENYIDDPRDHETDDDDDEVVMLD